MSALGNRLARFIYGLQRPSKASNLRRLRARGESPESFRIRHASAEEIPALAALHVRTWSDTYWLNPHPPRVELREKQWREKFAERDPRWFCLVVEGPDGRLVGFAEGRPFKSDQASGPAGQLSKIYLLQEYQRLGLGRRLIGEVARCFLERGITSMILFGVPENPSGMFHEAMGGQRVLTPEGRFDGGYAWTDLRELA